MNTTSPSTESTSEKGKRVNPRIFQVLYFITILSGIWGLIDGDYLFACSQWGLGLIFDPFDETVPFGKRPLWQRLVSLSHLAAIMLVFILEFAL